MSPVWLLLVIRFQRSWTPNIVYILLVMVTLTFYIVGDVFALIQIYVEIERARLTRILASIREGQGNITEAANVLQELQVCHSYHVSEY